MLLHMWRPEDSAAHCSMDYLKSKHEEADMKIILHAINSKDRGADRPLVLSQDRNVLVPLVLKYPRFTEILSFVPTSGKQ